MVIFHGGDAKEVLVERFRVGSAGKLALHGQGNCHGVSSTMASFLLPFCQSLGIDLKYRGGMSSGQRNNNIEQHQWLEFTCRPSMETFTSDLWFEGEAKDSSFVTEPIDSAYRLSRYPNGKCIIGTKSQALNDSDIQ